MGDGEGRGVVATDERRMRFVVNPVSGNGQLADGRLLGVGRCEGTVGHAVDRPIGLE